MIWFNGKALDIGCLNKRAEMIKDVRDWLKQSKTKIRKWNSKLKKFELVDRPVLKFKHWIKVTRARFIPSRKNVRNSTIDIILNENRK